LITHIIASYTCWPEVRSQINFTYLLTENGQVSAVRCHVQPGHNDTSCQLITLVYLLSITGKYFFLYLNQLYTGISDTLTATGNTSCVMLPSCLNTSPYSAVLYEWWWCLSPWFKLCVLTDARWRFCWMVCGSNLCTLLNAEAALRVWANEGRWDNQVTTMLAQAGLSGLCAGDILTVTSATTLWRTEYIPAGRHVRSSSTVHAATHRTDHTHSQYSRWQLSNAL